MTQFWTITDNDGAIVEMCFATTDAETEPRDQGFDWRDDDHVAHPIDGLIDPLTMVWDGQAWGPSIPALRDRCWAAVKTRRDQAEWAGCTTALGRVDSDPDSQRKVSGAVQMAMIAQGAGAPFGIDWTMQDNVTVAHDAPAMIAMGVAVGQHVAACHEVALGKRAAIEAAETIEDLDAVDIEGGWPDAPAD